MKEKILRQFPTHWVVVTPLILSDFGSQLGWDNNKPPTVEKGAQSTDGILPVLRYH